MTSTDNEHEKEPSHENIEHEPCVCQKLEGKTYDCNKCMKKFCEKCPAAPIEDNNELDCIQCLVNETIIYTSTPNKESMENVMKKTFDNSVLFVITGNT